jgi:16S rRNA processing protein RimM
VLPTTNACSSKSLTDRLEVGRIAKAHGLKGDVVIAPISNRPERFAVGEALFDANGRSFVITSSRVQGDRRVVRIDGVEGRDAAEALRGTLLFGDPLGPLPDGEMWVHELVGSSCVLPDGTALGSITTVQENPAHDLLVLDSGVLIPMVFVVGHDAVAKVVTVDPPDGLLELFE